MEAYANDACRTVAAQVSEAVGFQGMTQSTADTLAEVLARYIEEVSHRPRRPTPAPPHPQGAGAARVRHGGASSLTRARRAHRCARWATNRTR